MQIAKHTIGDNRHMIRDAINKLTEDQIIKLIQNYEQLEQDGSIGECDLRTLAESLNVMGSGSIVLIMERVAFEAYRRLAHQHTKFLATGWTMDLQTSRGHLS
jgi:hypothetical protein